MSPSPRHDDPSPASGSPEPAGGQGMNQGMQVLSYLISGILAYGGLGWLGDHYFGTGFLLPTGIILGAALGIYLVTKRFAAGLEQPPGANPPGTTTTTKGRE